MAAEPVYTVKKLIALTPEMAEAISAFRFGSRIGSEADAIRRLIEAGLAASTPATSGGLHAHAADPSKAAVQATETAPPAKPKRAPKGGLSAPALYGRNAATP